MYQTYVAHVGPFFQGPITYPFKLVIIPILSSKTKHSKPKERSWCLFSPLDCGCAPGLLLLGVDFQRISVGIRGMIYQNTQGG